VFSTGVRVRGMTMNGVSRNLGDPDNCQRDPLAIQRSIWRGETPEMIIRKSDWLVVGV